jgi:ABC-type uncharacterized transport system substrate-binding protein
MSVRRRDFITVLGGAAAWPMAARAQQSAMPVVGYLRSNARSSLPQREVAFREGLASKGFVEGRNVVIDYRYAENQNDRLPALASELVRRQVDVIYAGSTAQAIDAAFATLIERRAQALVIDGDGLFTDRRQQLASMTTRHALPAIYATRDFPDAGGLMSYGANNIDADRLGGIYVGRILNGEKPRDLPVQQSVKVELIINLITAKTLGMTLPLSLLGRADEVIE